MSTPAFRASGLNHGPSDTTLYVTAYGTKADGVTDDSGAITTAAAALSAAGGGKLVMPAGNYYFASTLSWTWSNVVVVGQLGGGVTISSSQQQIINFTGSGTISNVTFQGIKFVSTYTAQSAPIYGLITAFSQSGTDFAMSNIQFIDCEFTGGGSEGAKLICQSPTNKVFSDITFLRCNFHDIGGFGIETQNHVGDSVVRLTNVVARECNFKNLGTFGSLNGGVGVSYSGPCTNMVVDTCTFDNCSGSAIEYTSGGGGTIVNNRFKGFQLRNGAPYIGIGIDNTSATTLPAMAIAGNQEIEAPPSPAPTWNIYYVTNSVIANNVTQGGGISNKGVVNSLFVGNMIKSIDGYGLYFTSTSTGNKIVGNVIDISGSASPVASVQFDGASTTNNEVLDNDLITGVGSSFSQINSSTGNIQGLNRINGTTYTPSLQVGSLGTGTVTAGALQPSNGVNVNIATNGSANSVTIGAAGITMNNNGNTILSQGLRQHRTTVADANYTMLGTDYFIAYTSISAARVVSLAQTGSAALPSIIVIKDESGSASATNKITATPVSGLIDGAASKDVVVSAYGSARIYCNGTNFFTF